jgi:hypothetical protein
MSHPRKPFVVFLDTEVVERLKDMGIDPEEAIRDVVQEFIEETVAIDYSLTDAYARWDSEERPPV